MIKTRSAYPGTLPHNTIKMDVRGNFVGSFYMSYPHHGMQRRMISVDNFFVFLRLLYFAVLLLYVT